MIDENIIVKIIKDFQENALPDAHERSYQLPAYPKLNRAITVIGPRRAGKSYLMLLTIRKLLAEGVPKTRMLRLNLEDIALSSATAGDMQRILNIFFSIYSENVGHRIWLFLDEVQNITGWEKFARSAIDNGIYVYISGSSSKLLSREIATEMRGRSISYVLYPLSFAEFLGFKGIDYRGYLSTKTESTIINAAEDYLNYGGYPEVAIAPEMRESILKEILEVTISRDVIERYHVRNAKVIRLLLSALANSFEFSTNKFYNFLKSNSYKISKNTLYVYMQALNDTFAVYFVRNYSNSYKRREQSIPKPYFVDNGLLRASGVTDSPRLLENLVFTELLRKQGIEHVYYAKAASYNLDFVVTGKDNRPAQLVQVSYEISHFSTLDRELRSLYNASKHVKCKNLLLITMNEEKIERYRDVNIKIIPIWKWLLQE